MSRKRAAEGSVGPAKRTRFVSPEDDPARFEETVDDALETGARRGAVKTDGYESDSTDEGEGVVFSRHKKADEDGDADDLFAMDDDDGGGTKPKADDAAGGKKKKTEYLQLGDIEGQEFRAGGGSGSDESSEDEDDALDEDDAERIRRAKARGYDDRAMGFELSQFNMKTEMDEGKFQADGSYVRARDPHEMHDKWLDDADARAIKKARRAHRARLKKQKELEAQEDARPASKAERERDLVSLMRPSESVLEALQRLGAKKKQQAKQQKKKDKDAMAIDGGAHHVKTPIELEIEQITELASALMVENVDVYSATYEELLRSVRRSKLVPDDWKPPEREPKVEYRWKGGDGQTFGPYSQEEMAAWRDADYFGGPEASKIELRPVGSNDWKSWDDVFA
ncbi:hypothetical protein AURDEDRAFT_78013 [Auricularia subglabra TFB-10046 SS5]|nr:hypothetical protein AURDEDRAFT_78013 [Auricularia subglabra TFB-10046 SS5]